MNSNTDGSHGKQCLDSNKLNSLKVLVLSQFPVESEKDKDKLVLNYESQAHVLSCHIGFWLVCEEDSRFFYR